jgi:hypothetical protein
VTQPPEAGLRVVETWDGRVYLGTVERDGETLTVRTGFAGRPVILHEDDVAQITSAHEHPDVEVPSSTTAGRLPI